IEKHEPGGRGVALATPLFLFHEAVPLQLVVKRKRGLGIIADNTVRVPKESDFDELHTQNLETTAARPRPGGAPGRGTERRCGGGSAAAESWREWGRVGAALPRCPSLGAALAGTAARGDRCRRSPVAGGPTRAESLRLWRLRRGWRHRHGHPQASA